MGKRKCYYFVSAAKIVVFCMLILFITNCNKKEGASVKISEKEKQDIILTVWSPSEDQDPQYGEWLVTMCNKFNNLHPEWNISFNYGVCTESNAKKLIPQDVESAADVFIFSSTGLEQLCSTNCLAEFGGKYLEEINKHFSSILVDCLKWEGGVYGVPMTTNTFFMYYDKSKFTENDVKLLETMLKKGKVAVPLTNGFYNSAFYLGAGCDFFNNGTTRSVGITLNTDTAVAVTDYLVDIVKNENFIVAEPEEAISMMREGKCDAYWCGTWQTAQTKEILGENFGVCILPSFMFNGREVPCRPFGSCKAIGVNSTTKYPLVCVELALYLGGYDGQLAHYEMRGYVPCYDTLVNDTKIRKNSVVAVDAITNSQIAVPRASFIEMGYFWTPAETFGKELRDGIITHANAREKTMAFHKAVNSSGVK